MSIFHPFRPRRFRTQRDARVVPAADLAPDGVGDALDDFMAMAEAAGVVAGRTDFDLWDAELNPLASGHYCPTCGTRLDKADRPCPFAPHEETR